MKKRLLILFIHLLFVLSLYSQEDQGFDEFFAIRNDLIDSLFMENDPVYREIKNAFLEVRRDLYIDSKYQSIAYKNMPVPAKYIMIMMFRLTFISPQCQN